MGSREALPNLENLNLGDRRDDSLETPKAAQATSTAGPQTSKHPSRENTASRSDDRDAALRAELAAVQRINQVVEGVISSLEHAKANMATVSRTVQHASSLLDSWTRILSQTEHNQRLILNPAWQGASQDIADAEGAALARQREKERLEAEEAQRREAAEERRRVEEERRAVEAATPGKRVVRGRGRGGMGSVVRRGGAAPGRGVTTGVGAGIGAGRGGRGVGRGPVSTGVRGGAVDGRGTAGRGRARDTAV